MSKTTFRNILTFAITASAALTASAITWGEWEDFATGTYDAHYWYRSPMRDLEVRRRVSTSDPMREQYMVVGLFGQTPGWAPIDLIIDVNKGVQGPTARDYSMWVDDQYIESYDIYGERKDIYLCDGYTYYDNYFPMNPDYAMQYEDASYYREETGVFNIYAYYHYPDGTVPFLDAFYNEQAHGPETLTLSGPQFKNYTCDITGLKVERTEDGAQMEGDIQLNDLGKIRICAVAGKVSDVRSVAERMSRGEGVYEELTVSGSFSIPAEDIPGIQTLVYLTYCPDGSTYQFGSQEYEYDPDWTSLGTAMFTDGFISKFLETDMTVNHGYQFEESDFTYPVEVEESLVAPGLYRLVNPYGTTSPYWNLDFSALSLDKRKTHYMTVNATDPDRVTVEYSNSGFYYGTEPLVLYSEAHDWLAEGYDAEQVPGNLWGRLQDGVISFPDGEEGAGVLCAKINGSPADICGRALKIVLPGGGSAVSQVIESAGAVVWFDLHGRMVSVPLESGIYIRCQGGEKRKVVIAR